ncbi:unnamed protein product [Blepharisma stoltei]|uniref:HECT E3 ubiquitin ligase n=1 Tax=Blepharisma stoltei TaxID=1481888 RepID=A0AAU9ISS7_9CILI|nr:unnamed protein product [Blepharisma stoltei]
MGNSASDIVQRVGSLSNDALVKTLGKDAELLKNPEVMFDVSELLVRSDLDSYHVPGSESLGLKIDDVGTKDEESMMCSLINSARLREKHEDTIKSLLEEILRKRGDDPNSKEMILRMQGFCRIFEALLRMEEREKRNKAEKEKEAPKKTVIMPPLARATMRFGFNTLLRIVNMMGSKNPNVYKFMISHTSEVLAEMQPLSLKTDDPSVNATIDKMVVFFEKILSGELGNLSDQDKKSSISSLFALAIASGNLLSILALANHFLKLKNEPEFASVVQFLTPHLKSFKELKIYDEDLTWDNSRSYNNMTISGNQKTISARVSNYSAALSTDVYTTGVHYFEFLIEQRNDDYYIGVADSAYANFDSNYDSRVQSYTYRTNGYYYIKDSSQHQWQSLMAGDRLGVFLNMDKKTVTFYKNGEKDPKGSQSIALESAKVIGVTYGNCQISIVDYPELPSDIYDAVYSAIPIDLDSKVAQLIESNQSLAGVSPSEITAFVLKKLANLNSKHLAKLNNGQKLPSKKSGISLDVQVPTIEILDSIIAYCGEISKHQSDVSQETCIEILDSAFKLLQAHLLGSAFIKECDLNLQFRHNIIEHTTEILNLLPNTKASEQGTATLTSCFSVFYDEPQEKLAYLVESLEGMIKGQEKSGVFKELEDKILLEMASPEVLFPALELINDEYAATIEKYLFFLCDLAASHSIKLIDGTETTVGIIKLLESSQIVLIAQAAKANFQGKWQDILVSYSIKVCQASDDVLKHVSEKHKVGLLPDNLVEKINKTIVKNVLEGLLFSLMLSKLGLDFLSKIMPLLQNIIASLAFFMSTPPKLTLGSGIVTTIYESSHNYDNNLDLTYLVKTPQAKKYTLVFDPQCRTENGCDYLILYTDESKSSQIARWEGENFPKEPFEVNQTQMFFTFHSDGSVNYWGWKIEIKAVVEMSYYKKQWPDTTKEACGMLLGLISTKLISGDFELAQEDEEASKLLSNPLLMYGIKDSCLVIAKEPGKINENLMTLSTTPGIGEKLKKAMLTRSYSEDVSRRVIRSQQVAKTLDDYVSDYGYWESPTYSDVPFLQEFIEGKEWCLEAWKEIKKKSGVVGPATNIGGSEMDQAERAVFAVYTAFFEMVDTVSKLFHNPSDIGITLKNIVKQTNLIRGWAQKHKQLLMDKGNPDITYTDICLDIVKKCTILLGSEYKLSLNELGVSKVMRHLLSSVVKAQKSDKVKVKEDSKWNILKEAVGVASTLKNLLTISSKSGGDENDDMKEFGRVQELVNSFLESPCSVEKIVDLLDQRRTRAIARVLGYLSLANFVNISPRQETNLIRAFGDSLRSKGTKKHYWHSLEGVDPCLLSIVQKSFYQIFGLLQKELIRSRQRPLTLHAYNHYLSVLEAMSSPLRGVDAYMILELQLTSTVNILLSWAKGHVGEEVINRPFQLNKCITRLGVFEGDSSGIQSAKILANRTEEGTETWISLDKGGENVLPISELIISDSQLEDYEDATGPIVIAGQTKYIMVKREDPRSDGKYLTDIPDLSNPTFTSWDEIAASEPAEEKKERERLKERLSKSAWSLFKILMYSIVGSMNEYNESKKILVQELFVRVLFVELKWDDTLHQPDSEDFKIGKLSSGSPWIGQMLVPKGYQKNPMVEWLRQFKFEIEHYEDFVIKDVINEFVEKADPAMKGVLTHNDLVYVDEVIASTLQSFEENKNYKGEFDFFRYLRVLRSLAGDFPLDVQEYIENSKLWQTLPEDFYTASRDYDMSNISRIQEIIAARLTRTDENSFTQILERFVQSETPGIVDKSQLDEKTPNEFKNSSQNLDLYVTLHAIIRNQQKFESYYNELQEVFRIYDDLPASCEEILKERKGQSNYIGSLLWTLYGCFGSNCIVSVLAREEYLEELLKLTFLSSSENTILIGARILAKVLPGQHSPQSFSKAWDNLTKYLPLTERKLDFTTLLFNKLGKASFWYGQKEHQKALYRWGYEIISLILALGAVERWRAHILDKVIESLQKAVSSLISGTPLDLSHIGVLYFLGSSAKNNDQVDSVPLELSRIKLKSSNFAQGTIKNIDGVNITVYSVVEDSELIEPEANIEAVEPYVTNNFYTELSLDEKKNLARSVMDFWKALQESYEKPLKGKADMLGELRVLYTKIDMYALLCISDLFEKKDMANESEIEDVLRLVIKKKNVSQNFSRDLYSTIMTEINKKLKKNVQAEEEEEKEMTEEQAMAKLAQMKEEDQILATELLSLDIPVLRIVKCFEQGIKEMDKILSYQDPAKEQKASLGVLYSLGGINFQTKDPEGHAEIFQNKQSHFVISNSGDSALRKEITASIPATIFHNLETFCSSLTFLAALEGTPSGDQLNYGLKLGDLELRITQDPGFACLMVNGDIACEVNLSQPVELRIFSKPSGYLSVVYGTSHTDVHSNSVFNGLELGKFGLFMMEGESASLLAFEIHDGKYEGAFKNKYNKAAPNAGGENYVTVKCKKDSNDRLRLRMMGYSDEQITEALGKNDDLLSAINYLYANHDQKSMSGETLSLIYESIISVKLFDTLADVPKGFIVAPVYEDGKAIEYDIPNRKILAFKKEKLTEGNVCTGFCIGESIRDAENLGEFAISTANDRSLPVWAKISPISKKETSIKDIALIKTAKVHSVQVPRGFLLICDKEGKALNVAPKNEKNYYIFVAVKYQQSLLDCFITPFSSVSATASAFGIVDQFEGGEKKVAGKEEEVKYDQLSVMELFSKLWRVEESRLQKSSKKLLLSLLKASETYLLSLSDKEGFGKVVDFLGEDLNMLSNSFDVLLGNSSLVKFREEVVKESLEKLLKYCIQPSDAIGGMLASLIIESNHPYEDNMNVDDVISIRGARALRIEFDSQCYTENNCDQLRFYEGPNRSGELACYTGQGESVWKPLDVPGDTVYTYFHSDGSVHYWGYKFTVIPVGSTSGDSVERPDSALWMLEKIAKIAELDNGLELSLSPRLIQPLFLFSLTASQTDEKCKAIDIIRKLLRGQQHSTMKNILQLLLQEATTLYNANKSAKSSHPLLQALILLLAQNKDRYQIDINENWFVDFCELLSDMKGLADKDASLEDFLFENFRTKVNALEKIFESSHPYERIMKKNLLEIQGASSLTLDFDPQTKVLPYDDIYLSYDEAGLKNAQDFTSIRQLKDAKWANDPKGPDISFSNNNMTVTRTNSSGWGCALWNETYSSKVTTIKFYIDNSGDSTYLYIGVFKAGEEYSLSTYIGTDSPTPVWSWKISGEFCKKGSSQDGQPSYTTGDLVGMQIDMNSKVLTFFKNDVEVYKFTDIADAVVPVICFGGSNQLVTIRSVEQVSSAGNASMSDKKIEVAGSSVYLWFPINKGFTSRYFWEGNTNSVKSADELTISKTGEGQTIHSTTARVENGRHYAEVKICSEEEVGVGFFHQSSIEENKAEDQRQAIYYSTGKISSHDSGTDGFTTGDTIGCYIDMEAKQIMFFKNGIFLIRFINENIAIGETYKFGAVLTVQNQSLAIIADPNIPNEIDILNPVEAPDKEEWGYKVKVVPSFRGRNAKITESILSFLSEETQKEWKDGYRAKFLQLFKSGAADQLVIYLDEMTQAKGLEVLQLTPENLNPTADELIYYPELERLSKDDITELYKILVNFNSRIENLLYLFNLHVESYSSMTELQRVFMGSRNYIFFKLKNGLLKEGLSKTACESRTEITVDRPKAARHRHRKDVDVNGQFSVFGQVYRLMLTKGNREYRNSERFFRVTYRGEAATDAGGPYNETISNMCDELMSSFLRLLIPIPNNVNNMGENRDCWIVNPAAETKNDMELYLFLGKLMGAAIRTQNNLNLSLSPLFWKRLLLDPVDIRDLRATDVCTVQILEILRNLEANSITKDNFSDAYDIKFTTKDTSGRDVELIENGANRQVTFDDAKEYAELVEKFRLNEGAKAYEMIRKGISAVIPLDYLNLFSWRQVQTLVCGAPTIDIDILKGNTDYESCGINDAHIQLFWDVVGEMSQKERSLLIKFIWGRSRLPSGRDWRHMKITRYNPPGAVNNYLPVTHTCFFTIDLPPYTTRDAMKNKLLYAITHCSAIDLDGSASAGWEDAD